MAADSTSHILQSLVVNVVIVAAKGVAAFFTGSGAMLAETLHSAADCANQVLLLVGVKRSKLPPTAEHPLGHGRQAYFWSFLVALLLFSGGGLYSMYEGVHKVLHPDPLEHVALGVGILAFALALEGYATFSNVRELKKRAGGRPLFTYLRQTKESDLLVVFGENSAATLGLLLALAALGLAWWTGDPHWDGYGSFAVGVVLVGVAVFMAVEVTSLLVGEAADPEFEKAAHEVAAAQPGVAAVLRIITIQQGPGEVLVALKIKMSPELTTEKLCRAINDFERALKEKRPDAKWCFVEPDIRD